MTNDMQPMNLDQNNTTFGARLQAAREAMGLDRKAAAAQLRLNERIIIMLETGDIDPTLPLTFLRGYIRSYGKLLQIPEPEITQALELFKLPTLQGTPPMSSGSMNTITSQNYSMQFFTTLIVLTVIGLVGAWWHNHTGTSVTVAENVPIAPLPAATNNGLIAVNIPTAAPAQTPAPTAGNPNAPAPLTQSNTTTPITDNPPISPQPPASAVNKPAPVKPKKTLSTQKNSDANNNENTDENDNMDNPDNNDNTDDTDYSNNSNTETVSNHAR